MPSQAGACQCDSRAEVAREPIERNPRGWRCVESGTRLVPKEAEVSIFTILFIILLLAWILGWGVFHVAGFLIHILLIAAIIALILHFVRGTARTV